MTAAVWVLGLRVAAAPCAGVEETTASAARAMEAGRYAEADRLSAEALARAPGCPDALVLHGRLLASKGEAAAARQALETAARLAPAHAEARYQLGVFLYRRQLHPGAVAELEQAVALRPGDARALDYLALSLEGLGEAERAEKAYERARTVNDGPLGDPFFDYYYGRFLLKQDRLEESRRHLDRAVARHPDARAVRYERAKLSLARRDYAAARLDAERALGLHDPAVLDVQLYYLLANVYARLGERELARQYADRARNTPFPDQAR